MASRARSPSSDTLTDFLEGTLESGHWTAATVLFGRAVPLPDGPRKLDELRRQFELTWSLEAR